MATVTRVEITCDKCSTPVPDPSEAVPFRLFGANRTVLVDLCKPCSEEWLAIIEKGVLAPTTNPRKNSTERVRVKAGDRPARSKARDTEALAPAIGIDPPPVEAPTNVRTLGDLFPDATPTVTQPTLFVDESAPMSSDGFEPMPVRVTPVNPSEPPVGTGV